MFWGPRSMQYLVLLIVLQDWFEEKLSPNMVP